MTEYLIYVQPGAKQTELIGEVSMDGAKFGRPGKTVQALKLKLASPPVDGAANKELIKFMAGYLQLPQSQLEIKRGHKSRYKVLINC